MFDPDNALVTRFADDRTCDAVAAAIRIRDTTDEHAMARAAIWELEQRGWSPEPRSIFAPRYKRYATWLAVIWCRLRGHPSGARFHSGEVSRCIDCGDVR